MSGDELAKISQPDRRHGFPSFNLLPRMTLEENVELPLRLAEVERSDRGDRVREALKRVGLARASFASPRRIEAAASSSALHWHAHS